MTKKALCNAIGQVLLYRQAINPRARAVIVGYPTAETLAVLPLVAELGLEVVCWQDEAKAEGGGMKDEGGLSDLATEVGLPTEGMVQGADTRTMGASEEANQAVVEGGGLNQLVHGVGTHTMLSKPGRTMPDELARDRSAHGADTRTMQTIVNPDQFRSFRPQPSALSLQWNVASLALAHGMTNPSRLATRLHIGRQGLYAVWNGTSGQVTIELLGRLAHLFQVEPGDWFVWEPEARDQGLVSSPQPPAPRLLWNIAVQAEARGLDIVQLGFRAEVHTASMRPIWRGEAQAVAPATLGRLAQALDLPGQPFCIGELFRW